MKKKCRYYSTKILYISGTLQNPSLKRKKSWNFLRMQFLYLAGCSSTAFSTRAPSPFA